MCRVESGKKLIDLKNGYAVDNKTPKNYVLYRWETVNEKMVDQDGKTIKIEKITKKGKKVMVAKMHKVDKWVFKGYYGKLHQLARGMAEYECHATDVSTLEELLFNIEQFTKSFDVSAIEEVFES